MQNIGEKILSNNYQAQKLTNSNAGYYTNPIAKNWHYDTQFGNHLAFCVTLKGETTQYIDIQHNSNISIDEVHHIKSIPDITEIKQATANTMMIFRGNPVSMQTNNFFNSIQPLVHRSPPENFDTQEQRHILLVRFKLARSDNRIN